MKKWILAVVMMSGLTVLAQHKRHHENNFTSEQQTELQVKKMTLALDLTSKQQTELQKFFLDRNTKRQDAIKKFKADKEAGKKLTSDERFTRENAMLDDKIAMKKKMAEILNAEQLAKLQEMHKGRERRKDKLTKSRKNYKKYDRR